MKFCFFCAVFFVVGSDKNFVAVLEESYFAAFGVASCADRDEGGFWIIGKFD